MKTIYQYTTAQSTKSTASYTRCRRTRRVVGINCDGATYQMPKIRSNKVQQRHITFPVTIVNYPVAAANQMVRILGGEAREPVGCTRGKVPTGDRKKRRGKNGLEKGKEGNGTINESPGLNTACSFSSLNVTRANCPPLATRGVRLHRDKIPLGAEP